MQKLIFPLFILFTSLWLQTGYSQTILAPDADFSDTAEYVGGAPDSLFVFNIDNDSKYILADTHNYPGFTVEWQEYIPGTGFQALSTNPRIDISDSPISQGYKLIFNGAGAPAPSVCWVLINDFSVEILTKDENDSITNDALTSGDCVWIGYIEMDYKRNRLVYYDPVRMDTSYVLTLSYVSSDTTTPTPADGYGKMYEADSLNGKLRFAIDNSWWEKTENTITITDAAGLSRSDFLYVKAIRPHAVIGDPEYIKLNDKEFYPDRDTLYYRAYDDNYHGGETYSAPGYYRFTSESFNADSLIWQFGDNDSVKTSKTLEEHLYTQYGSFEVGLTAINYFDFRRECYHSADPITVELTLPKLEAPNVFSPPSGENPIWRYYDVSITDFEIAIYNRYGRRVHYFKGNVRDWGGWDGSANKSSNYVSTGVYYYVLKDFSHASLFNEPNETNLPTFEDVIYSGNIHVFNTED